MEETAQEYAERVRDEFVENLVRYAARNVDRESAVASPMPFQAIEVTGLLEFVVKTTEIPHAQLKRWWDDEVQRIKAH